MLRAGASLAAAGDHQSLFSFHSCSSCRARVTSCDHPGLLPLINSSLYQGGLPCSVSRVCHRLYPERSYDSP